MLITNPVKFRRFHSHRRSGFTLVELLVVIGIIAILASVVAVAAGAAINQAKRTKAATLANQLQTAVLSYYTEYGVYPVKANTTEDTLFQTAQDWQPLSVALNGGIDPGNPMAGQITGNAIPNTRQIAYLSLTRTDLDSTAGNPWVPKNPFKDNRGRPQYFYLAVDSDYSNVLGDSGAVQPPDFSSAKSNSTALPPGKAISAGVAVWANCDPNSTGTGTTHPSLWVHTY